MNHYLLVVEGGTEPYTLGPYESVDEQFHAAREQWAKLDKGFDQIFWLDTNSEGVPTVCSFTDGDLERESNQLRDDQEES